MLVLSRKLAEKIVIDGQITIVITQIKGNRVRIGIEAPPHVPVQRAELRDKIAAEAQPSGSGPVRTARTG